MNYPNLDMIILQNLERFFKCLTEVVLNNKLVKFENIGSGVMIFFLHTVYERH